MFDSFDIRRVSDNSIADINEVDKRVCEHFNLDFNENDYGHFFFTLEEDEKEKFSHFQKSISWVGLLHVIIYYTEVDFGKKSLYEMLGALIFLSKNYIHFPKCTEDFTSSLLLFLQEEGLYVHVNFNDSGKDCVNLYNGHTMWKNVTGIFESDEHGVLLEFHPSMGNLSTDQNIYRNVLPCINKMVIPEGIKSISSGFFFRSQISERIVFPNSLGDIGGGEIRQALALELFMNHSCQMWFCPNPLNPSKHILSGDATLEASDLRMTN